MKLLFIFLFSIPLNGFPKLLDKVIAVIGEEIITLSEVQRVEKNYDARSMIASLVYEKGKQTKKKILDSKVKIFVIRKKLTELGIIIDDEAVENRVKQIEKGQGVTRDFLVSYLKSQNLSFNEYFELIKQMMEVSYFNSKIIAPLVSVSEQEIKNFYSGSPGASGQGQTYNVINFTLSKKILSLYNNKEIVKLLKKYQISGTLPDAFSEMSTNKLSLESNSLSKEINTAIKKTRPKSFSKPIVIGDILHVFFVESKKSSNSNSFKKNMNQLRQQLMVKKSKETINKWVENERNNYFIKYFL